MAIVLGLNYRIMRSKFSGGKFRRWWTSGDGYVTAWYIVCTVVKLPSLIDNLHRCFSVLFFSDAAKREKMRGRKERKMYLSNTFAKRGSEQWKVHELFNEIVLRFYQRTVEFFLWQLFVPASFTTGAPRRNARRNPALDVSPYYRILNALYFPGCCSSPARFSTSFAFVLALTSFSIKLATFNRPVL